MIDKAAGDGDLVDGQLGRRHEVGGAAYALAQQPAVWRQAERYPESAREVPDRKAAAIGELRQRHVAIDMLHQDVGGAALLPLRQPGPRTIEG